MTERLQRLAAQVVIPLLDLRLDDLGPVWAQAEVQRDRGHLAWILFGGEREALRERLTAFRAGAPGSVLICSDLERGAGQQVRGCSQLPSAMAIAATGSRDLAFAAGRQVGAEAVGVGIDWIFAPVLDLADEPANPIVGTRSFAAEPADVVAYGGAFLEGIQAAGALACAKHYPGHGATTDDSHAELPVVKRPGEVLRARDLIPFRRAVEAGVATIMSAHVLYPTLGEGDLPATVSPTLIRGLLRDELGFEGVVVTDALIMAGVLQGRSEGEAAIAALEAGCDALLYPEDVEAVADQVAAWAAAAPANAARLEQAAARVQGLADRRAAASASVELDPALEDRLNAAAIARVGGAKAPLAAGERVGLLLFDDDDQPGFGHELTAELSEAGVELYPVALGREPGAALGRLREVSQAHERLVAVVGCRVRAWKGRPGLNEPLGRAISALPGAGLTVVGLCGPYPLRGVVPLGAELIVAWDDSLSAQRAAARVLLGGEAPGGLPVSVEV